MFGSRSKLKKLRTQPRWYVKLWRLCKFGLLLCLLGAIGVLAIDRYISWSTKGSIYHNIADVPPHDVGLVPGTSKYIGRRLNTFYTDRIENAIELYNTGKVKDFILSGDNAHRSYNEPWTMKRDLLKAGVHENDIYLDYAGFRTLDSVIRAREIFQANHFLIVTQNFHCERALFIAQYHDIDANCLAVPDPEGRASFYVRVREVFARTKAVLDLYILNQQPRFLGPSIPIESNDLDDEMDQTATDDDVKDEDINSDAKPNDSKLNDLTD